MAKVKPFSKGEVVKATDGKHSGETGTVEHSDKSITIVKFDKVSDPVWTSNLERAE